MGLHWRSTWSSAVAYAVDDAVNYLGTSYVAIQAGTNHTPDPAGTAYWAVLAAKGDTGATGSTGATGATGPAGPTTLATTATEGVARLSTAPADSAHPIALGANDAAVTNTRTPTDGTVTDAKIVSGATWRKPSDYGLLAYNYPPPLMTLSGGTNGNGIWHIQRVLVPSQITIASIAVWLTQAGATFASNRNFQALWKLDGTLIAWSAEATVTTAWGTLPGGAAGKVTAALDTVIAGQSLTLPAGAYYVGLSAGATTAPNFGRYNTLAGSAAMGRTAAQGRDVSVTAAVAAATPPSTVAPMPALVEDTKAIWMGLV